MATTIEKLTSDVNEIKNSLNELKNNVSLSEQEKKEQADVLKSQADEKKQEIENEIKALEGKTDATSLAEKEAAEALLTSFNEISDLYLSILNSTGSQTVQDGNEGDQDEKKGVLKKTKDWIGEQWNDVRDKEKWRDEKGKNLLRSAGFVATGIGLGALIYGGCKRLFGKEAREGRKQSRKERREARKAARKEKREAKRKERASKPFWDRWYGKALKWGAIGTGVYWLAHGIFTGNWFKDFGKRGSRKTETAENQVSKYKELPPEVREKYENIGGNVNNFYGKVWAKENSNGYESPYDLGTISKNVATDAGISDAEVYKGLVPFCMDDGLKNVDQLLSERNFTTYLFDKDTTEVMTKVKSYLSSAVGNILGTFVSSLGSFIPFSKLTGSLSDKIEAWFKSDPTARIDELNFFFRQYTKVLTYMKDKEKSIAYKIAEEKCASELDGKSEDEKNNYIQNKLNDDSWFEENVKKDSRYKNFMNSKILNSGDALASAGVFNGEMSPILKEGIVEPLDNEFDNIMQVDVNSQTVVDKGMTELDTGILGNQTKSDLIKMCVDLKEDMDVNNEGGGLFRGFSHLFNSEASNKDTFLEESGLEGFVNELSTKIDEIKVKIENKTVTKDELQKLKDTALAYFAFQKEMQLAIYTFQSIRSDNPDALRRLVESQVEGFNNFRERLNRIFSGNATFGDYLVVGIGTAQITLVVSSRARRAVGGAIIDVTKRTAKKPIQAITWVAGRPAFSDAGFRKALQGLREASHKESYFLHYALNGKIRNERFLLDIAKNDLGMTPTPTKMGDVFHELLKGQGVTKEQCDLLWKYAGNPDIKKLVMTEEYSGRGVSDVLADGFKPTTRTFTVDTANLKKLEDVDKLFSESYIINNPKAKKLLEDLLRKSVHNADDLRYIGEIFIDDDFFKCLDEMQDTPKAIRGMAKHLDEVKKSEAFSTLTTEIRKITTSGSVVPTKLSALEDFRRGLASISPKEFEFTEECVKLFAMNGDFMDNMKIINKIVRDGIQGSGGRAKKITVEYLVGNIDDVINRLQNATPSWKASVGAGNEVDNFIKVLREMKTSKMFSSATDTTKVLRKVFGLAAKLT